MRGVIAPETAMDAERRRKMATQRERILHYLKTGKPLTGIYATNVMHIMEYRKRISELRREGYTINDRWVYEYWKKGKNRGKLRIKYKKYWLAA